MTQGGRKSEHRALLRQSVPYGTKLDAIYGRPRSGLRLSAIQMASSGLENRVDLED